MFWTLAVLVAIAWLVFGKPKPTRKDIAKAESDARLANESLAEFTFEDTSPDAERFYQYRRFQFLFIPMGVRETRVSKFAGGEGVSSFHLRRVDATKWQTKETDESVDAHTAAVEREIPEDDLAKEIRNDDLRVLRKPSTWVDLPDPILGPLETRYQRFLLHYRDGV